MVPPINSTSISTGVRKPHTGHIANIRLFPHVKQYFCLPEKTYETEDSHHGDELRVFFFEIYIFSLCYQWQIHRQVAHYAQIYTQCKHGKLEKKHHTVRALPELPEKVCFIDAKSCNSHPTCTKLRGKRITQSLSLVIQVVKPSHPFTFTRLTL